MGTHEDLLARHRRVMPSWLVLYYEEPIELVDGEGRRVTRRRGQRVPRLLRRHPHHHVGHSIPEVVEAIRSRPPKMLHASTLYLSRTDRARRAHRRAVEDPRRQGLLHHLGHRSQRRRAVAGHHTGSRIRSWRFAKLSRPSPPTMAITGNATGRSTSLYGVATSATYRAATGCAAPSASCPTTTTSRPAWTTSRTCSTSPPPATWPA